MARQPAPKYGIRCIATHSDPHDRLFVLLLDTGGPFPEALNGPTPDPTRVESLSLNDCKMRHLLTLILMFSCMRYSMPLSSQPCTVKICVPVAATVTCSFRVDPFDVAIALL